MPNFAIESPQSSSVKIWSATFDDNGAALVPEISRDFRQIGVRNRNIADDGEATLGSGTLKIQTAGVASPTLTEANHWLDTDDDILAALEIGKSYRVTLVGPLRLVLLGATTPSVIVEVR